MECRVVGEGTSGTRLLQLRERGPAAVNARVKCVCVCFSVDAGPLESNLSVVER